MESKIYFAHTVNSYDTDLEKEQLSLTKKFFGVRIENPNQPHHQKGYATYKERYKDHPTKSGMTYFYEEVLPGCDMCVCQIFLDGKWGAGVAHEAIFFLERGQPVWVIQPSDNKIRRLTTEEENMLISKNDSILLSIEETRFRIWGGKEPYQEKAIPYEKAHLLR